MQNEIQGAPILDVRNLDKIFHLHLVDGRIIKPLRALTFSVQPGALFVISGRSGIGKTTILKCIYRTYLATDGDIWYDSLRLGCINMATASEDDVILLRGSELGFCAQFLKVLPRVSALDIAAEPLMQRGIGRDDARTEAARWLKRLDIEEGRWQASPITFSGGEQQRLNLARAFIAAPRLLLLDEPTASLDTTSKAIVVDMIREAKASGVTIVTVSHDIAVLEPLADTIYWLETKQQRQEAQ